jgi:hypothetical protein
MFHADYYELSAVQSRAVSRSHLANLAVCAKCGDRCCTAYDMGANYVECAVCGAYGTAGVVIDGLAVCWDKCEV